MADRAHWLVWLNRDWRWDPLRRTPASRPSCIELAFRNRSNRSTGLWNEGVGSQFMHVPRRVELDALFAALRFFYTLPSDDGEKYRSLKGIPVQRPRV